MRLYYLGNHEQTLLIVFHGCFRIHPREIFNHVQVNLLV